MDNANPLANIGDLAKPANTLDRRFQMQSAGYTNRIRLEELHRLKQRQKRSRLSRRLRSPSFSTRTMAKFFIEEAKQQGNMEAITKALPLVTDGAKLQEIEDDWITHFFERARLISDNEMQKLWAAILAGQANAPEPCPKAHS